MAKGAKKQQLQSQTTKQAAPPSYAQPYVNDILNRASNLSYQPYQPYEGNRIAGFTDAEKTARTGIMGLQAPTQFNTATEMATKAGNYTPGQFDGGYDQAQFTGGNYGTGQFDDGYDQAKFTGGDYGTGQFDGGYDATQFTGGDYGTGQFDGGYDPTKFTGGNYATGQFNTNSFNDSGTASQYMSPYMQNVVDVQKQSAIRDAKQGQLAGNLGASRQGTYGGSRQLLANMERERNLGTQLGSIQATGSQAAYDAAQKQFGSEQDRRLQAQQYGEQSRQFGGSQSMEAQRQAEQSRQFGSSQGMEAQKQREASRQFGSNRQLQAQEAQERAKQFGANFGMDAQKQREQSRQFGATQRSQAEESAARERQFGANYRMDAQKQREQSRQYGADQRSRAEEAAARERQFGANYKMDAARMGEESRRFGASNALSAAGQLSQLGSAQQDSDLRRYGAMAGVGETERGLRQKGLDTAYDDFKNQRDYEKNQLRDYSDIVGAQPTGNTTESVYGKSANQTGALIGAAGNIGSAYMMGKAGNAAGGEIYSYNNGGLVALADGGGVDAGKQQGLAALAGDNDGSKYKLRSDPKELLYSTMGDPAKLQALTQQGADPTAVGIAAMLAKRIYDTQSMATAPQQTTVAGLLNPQPQQPQGQPQQPQGQPQQPQGQAQDQQGLAGIAPQEGQPPMGDPMQGQPPMDPMQAQGLEALAQQDQPMEEQPMEEPMMAANGGLMNINLPDDYYDEDSYAHGGIAHFDPGGEVKKDPGIMDYAGDVANWVKENPAETAAYGLGALAMVGSSPLSVPAVGATALARALPFIAGKVAPRVLNSMKALVSRAGTPAKTFAGKPAPELYTSARAFSPGRTAATLYGLDAIGDYASTPEGFEEAGRDSVAPTNSGLRGYLKEQDLSALPARREGPTEQEKLMDQWYAEMGKRYEPSGGSPQEPEFDYDAMRIRNRKELEDKYGASSPEEEAYLADLKKQKPLEDTSKQDFWRTMGEMSSKLTEGSLEGKGLLEAAAGATSVLPGSVAKSVENKKAREEKAEADNRSRRLELLNMQRSRRGDSIALDELATSGTDSAYNRYTDKAERDTTASNLAESQKREDFYKTQDNTLKIIELRLEQAKEQAKGPETTALQEKIDLLRTDPAMYRQIFKDENTLTPKDQLTGLLALRETADDETRPVIEAQIDEIMNRGGGGQGYKEGDTSVDGNGQAIVYKNGGWEYK